MDGRHYRNPPPSPYKALGCAHCQGYPHLERGWMETDNNGPIVACPICNKNGDKDRAYDMAEAQRDRGVQRR